MRREALFTFGLLAWPAIAGTQSAKIPTGESDGYFDNTGVDGVAGSVRTTEYTPLTNSERWRDYMLGTFWPGGILWAAASGGITQWEGTPKEWHGGAQAYGEPLGNSYAEYIIRKTLASGTAAVLHEDDRYIPTTDNGFWKRTKHAVGSAFVARNEAGQEHLAYSRFGSTLARSFISRERE